MLTVLYLSGKFDTVFYNLKKYVNKICIVRHLRHEIFVNDILFPRKNRCKFL